MKTTFLTLILTELLHPYLPYNTANEPAHAVAMITTGFS